MFLKWLKKKYDSKIDKLRYLHWRAPWIAQHTPKSVEKSLEGLFSFSKIEYGQIKKNQGDIVIVHLKPLQDFISLEEYLQHTRDIIKLETSGIFTNIFWGKKYFSTVIEVINQNGNVQSYTQKWIQWILIIYWRLLFKLYNLTKSQSPTVL